MQTHLRHFLWLYSWPWAVGWAAAEGWGAGSQISPGVWEDCPGSQTQLRLERAHQWWAGGCQHLLLPHWTRMASWLVQRQNAVFRGSCHNMVGREEDLGAGVSMERKHAEILPCMDAIACAFSEQEEAMRNRGSQEVTSSTGDHGPPTQQAPHAYNTPS